MAKTRNVLMTTMSILSNVNVNYYYYEIQEGKSVFCNGISSLEPGSKYFLSKYRIDEIVVVGTEETIKKDDVRKHDDVKSIYEDTKGMPINKEMLAYALYKMRISSFLREKGQIGEGLDEAALNCVAKNIPEKRKEELIELFKQKCFENPFILTNDELKQDNGKMRSPWYLIEQGIKESIDKDFEQTEDYKQYLHKIDNIMAYQEEYWKNLEVEGNSDKVIDAIRKDNELSFIEKEYCYISLQKRINEARLKNVIIDLKTDIANLEKINAQLQYEIDSLKNNRYMAELTYIKYIAYCELPEDNRIYPYKENVDKEVAIRFVNERIGDTDKYDNINGIVNALYGISDDGSVQDEDDEIEIKLYIDMQGGNRTSSYVRNAIISILNNQLSRKVKVGEVIGINFIPGSQQASEIVDETKRYRIMDLVSGMNAFIRYGKADIIKDYVDIMVTDKKTDSQSDNDNHDDSKLKKLVEQMVLVDDAICLNNVQDLITAIESISNILKTNNKEQESETFVDSIFYILKDGIEKDYGELLTLREVNKKKEIDYIELIDWCRRKDFVQQALTLIEDKMPGMFSGNVLKYSYDLKTVEKFFKDTKINSKSKPNKKIFEGLLWSEAEYELFELCDIEKICKSNILKKVSESSEVCIYNPDNSGKKIEKLDIAVKINEKLDADNEKLNRLVLLHKSLKRERNNCNHASEEKVRVSKNIILNAIGIYIENMRFVMNELKVNKSN